jgi:hypothetical protein
MGEIRNAYIILIGKPELKIPLGKSRCGWEENRRVFNKLDWCGLDVSVSG